MKRAGKTYFESFKVDCRLYESNYKNQQLADTNRTLKTQLSKMTQELNSLMEELDTIMFERDIALQERDAIKRERDTISELYQCKFCLLTCSIHWFHHLAMMKCKNNDDVEKVCQS